MQLQQQKQPYAFCPHKHCLQRTASEQDLVNHYAVDHDHLEKLLKLQNKLDLLEMKDKYGNVPSGSAATVKYEPDLQDKQDQLEDKTEQLLDICLYLEEHCSWSSNLVLITKSWIQKQ